MILHVHKFPNSRTLAIVREMPDGAPAPDAPFEAMTPEAFAAWSAPFATVEDDGKPPFNAATEKIIDDGVIVEPTRRRKSWVKVPLNSAELETVADAAELQQIRAVIEDLRTGTGTAAQRITRCERALVYLIKKQVAPALSAAAAARAKT